MKNIEIHKLFSCFKKELGDKLVWVVAVLIAVFSVSGLGLLIPSEGNFLTQSIPIKVIHIIFSFICFVLIGIIAALISVRPKIRRLELESATDVALGCYNQRECVKSLGKGISEANRYGTAFSVCLLDLDGLKKVNDEFGYSAGDNLLKEFVVLVQSSIRGTDTLFRYKQGDEFLILARNTASAEARIVAERIRAVTQRYRFESLPGSVGTFITVSIGITELIQKNSKHQTIDALSKRVEKALAEAKKNKNTIVVFDG